jgi:hypothetical protein
MDFDTVEVHKKAKVMLDKPRDWDNWIMIIEVYADRDDVWKFINPAVAVVDLPKLVEPVATELSDFKEGATKFSDLVIFVFS